MGSDSKSILFPCPRCGTGRGEGGLRCPSCGWHPDAIASVAPKPPVKPTARPYSMKVATLIGCLTILPCAYIVLFFLAILGMVSGFIDPSEATFVRLFFMHFGMILVSWCLVGFYVVHLVSRSDVDSNQKALWAVVLLLANLFAMPFYWYLHIWKPASAGE